MLSIALFLFLTNEYYCLLVLPQNIESLVLPTVYGNFEEKLTFFNKEINSMKGIRPVRLDWRALGKVSPVKDQAECAASWAFSAVANIESHLKIHNDVEEVLSEQFLIDCDDVQPGCKDGSILAAFGHIVAKFGGVLRSTDYYPYVEEQGECRWNRSSTVEDLDRHPKPVPVIGVQRVPPGYLPYEEEMTQAVFDHGPLSAAINSASMRRYEGGIDEPTDEDCNPNELDHAVLIVGYDIYINEDGTYTPYWIIKNSWGTDWGDEGYYYLVAGRNACGIASEVAFAYV